MENCNCKSKKRSAEDKKNLVIRFNRLIGQLEGTKRMVEEDRYCEDVLIQLAAIDKSIKSLAAVILDEHIHTCLVDSVEKGNYAIIDEITELFKRFN